MHWPLADRDATLTASEFTPDGRARQEGKIDTDARGKAFHETLDAVREQLELFDRYAPQDENALAAWMARHIEHEDLVPSDVRLWLRKLVASLTDASRGRGLSLADVVRARFRLATAAAVKIDAHRRDAHVEEYQRLLYDNAGGLGKVEATPAVVFAFPLNAYPYNRLYEGPERFRRHYYANVGDMNREEADVAHAIDNHELVETWVRNLERDAFGFWLPTAQGDSSPTLLPDCVTDATRLSNTRVLT